MIKYHQNELEDEGVYFILQFVFHQGKSGKKIKIGTWSQELMQRACKRDAYWLTTTGLLTLLSHKTPGHPGSIITTRHDLPIAIIN